MRFYSKRFEFFEGFAEILFYKRIIPLLFFLLGEKTASFQTGSSSSSTLDLNVLGASAFNTLSSHVATSPWVFCPLLSPQ